MKHALEAKNGHFVLHNNDIYASHQVIIAYPNTHLTFLTGKRVPDSPPPNYKRWSLGPRLVQFLIILQVESTGAIPPPLVLSSKINYIYRHTFISKHPMITHNLYHWIPCFIMSNVTTAAASVIGIVFLKQVNLCNDSNGAIPATLGLFPPHQFTVEYTEYVQTQAASPTHY